MDLFRGGAVTLIQSILSLTGDAHLKDTYQEINTDLQRYDLFSILPPIQAKKKKYHFHQRGAGGRLHVDLLVEGANYRSPHLHVHSL